MPTLLLPDYLYQWKRWALYGHSIPSIPSQTLRLSSRRRWEYLAISTLLITMIGNGAQPLATRIEGNLFGSVEFRSNQLNALPQWLRVLKQGNQDLQELRICMKLLDRCKSAIHRDWAKLIITHSAKLTPQTLMAVNAFFNRRWPYRTDRQNWQKEDWWIRPMEFIIRSGDCEDFAIIKYFTLREIGFSVDRIRLVVLKDIYRQLDHAVLSVSMDNQYYILDSLFPRVVEDKELLQYIPVYSINERHRWLHFQAKPSAASRTGISNQ